MIGNKQCALSRHALRCEHQSTCEPEDGLRDNSGADAVADIVVLLHRQFDSNALLFFIIFLFLVIL
jgi:hypothetical protein